jgi:hypothetical protein
MLQPCSSPPLQHAAARCVLSAARTRFPKASYQHVWSALSVLLYVSVRLSAIFNMKVDVCFCVRCTYTGCHGPQLVTVSQQPSTAYRTLASFYCFTTLAPDQELNTSVHVPRSVTHSRTPPGTSCTTLTPVLHLNLTKPHPQRTRKSTLVDGSQAVTPSQQPSDTACNTLPIIPAQPSPAADQEVNACIDGPHQVAREALARWRAVVSNHLQTTAPQASVPGFTAAAVLTTGLHASRGRSSCKQFSKRFAFGRTCNCSTRTTPPPTTPDPQTGLGLFSCK